MTLTDTIIKERDEFFARVGRLVLLDIAAGQNTSAPVASPFTPSPTPELAWSPTLDCGRVEHKAALAAVAKLNHSKFQGHTDWRLPEIRELLSLVDYTRTDPAIDTERFPDTQSASYWTNTPFAGDSGAAWIVSFNDGGAYWNYHLNGAFVRAVRGSSARASQ